MKHIDHDFHYNVGHFYGWWQFDVCPKSDKEILDTFKEINNCASASASGLNRLGFGLQRNEKEGFDEERTESRVEIPVKITPAGGYAYRIDFWAQVLEE